MNHPLMPALAEIKLLQDRLNEKIARIEALEAALRKIVDNGKDNSWPVVVARIALAPEQNK